MTDMELEIVDNIRAMLATLNTHTSIISEHVTKLNDNIAHSRLSSVIRDDEINKLNVIYKKLKGIILYLDDVKQQKREAE